MIPARFDAIDPTFRHRVTDVVVDKDSHQAKLKPHIFPNATTQYDLNHWCLAVGKHMKNYIFPKTQGHELAWLADNLPKWAITCALRAREYARAGIPVPTRAPPAIPEYHNAIEQQHGRPVANELDNLEKLKSYITKTVVLTKPTKCAKKQKKTETTEKRWMKW